MINHFVVRLYNGTPLPTNPSALMGNIPVSQTAAPLPYSPAESIAQQVLFGQYRPDGLGRLLACLELIRVVEASIFADRLTRDDPRVTYTSEQLHGMYEGAGFDPSFLSGTIARIPELTDRSFLSPDDQSLYRGLLRNLDRLALVVCWFGNR